VAKLRIARALLLPAVTALFLGRCLSAAAQDGQAVCDNYVTAGTAADEIRTLEEAGAASNVTGLSVADAERMFGPGYVSIGANGAVMSRDAVLQGIAARQPGNWASRFDIKTLDVRVYCDTAIVIGTSEVMAKGMPDTAKPLHFRWLNVWTHFKDGWRLTATQFA
jgi:hypothetical protein